MRARMLSLASLAAVATLLAGCGSGSGTAADPAGATAPTSVSAPTSSAAAVSKLPSCASIWKVGARLPDHYRGCQVGGVKAKGFLYHCEIGSRLATHGDDLYANVGGRIQKATPSRKANADWRYIYNHCVG